MQKIQIFIIRKWALRRESVKSSSPPVNNFPIIYSKKYMTWNNLAKMHD